MLFLQRLSPCRFHEARSVGASVPRGRRAGEHVGRITGGIGGTNSNRQTGDEMSPETAGDVTFTEGGGLRWGWGVGLEGCRHHRNDKRHTREHTHTHTIKGIMTLFYVRSQRQVRVLETPRTSREKFHLKQTPFVQCRHPAKPLRAPSTFTFRDNHLFVGQTLRKKQKKNKKKSG